MIIAIGNDLSMGAIGQFAYTAEQPERKVYHPCLSTLLGMLWLHLSYEERGNLIIVAEMQIGGQWEAECSICETPYEYWPRVTGSASKEHAIGALLCIISGIYPGLVNIIPHALLDERIPIANVRFVQGRGFVPVLLVPHLRLGAVWPGLGADHGWRGCTNPKDLADGRF